MSMEEPVSRNIAAQKDNSLGTGNFPSQVLSVSDKAYEFKSQNPYELKTKNKPS
jgi:hypothetical protein